MSDNGTNVNSALEHLRTAKAGIERMEAILAGENPEEPLALFIEGGEAQKEIRLAVESCLGPDLSSALFSESE